MQEIGVGKALGALVFAPELLEVVGAEDVLVSVKHHLQLDLGNPALASLVEEGEGVLVVLQVRGHGGKKTVWQGRVQGLATVLGTDYH